MKSARAAEGYSAVIAARYRTNVLAMCRGHKQLVAFAACTTMIANYYLGRNSPFHAVTGMCAGVTRYTDGADHVMILTGIPGPGKTWISECLKIYTTLLLSDNATPYYSSDSTTLRASTRQQQGTDEDNVTAKVVSSSSQ